ncbi:hypothetical protein GOV10_01785, partial [Candidatus Woesearchaeota archaeon]|nr:hypothetical protein [Candidatus Woesearchaeota archaeon]
FLWLLMHPHDSVKKRKDVLKEHEKEFKKFLDDEFEDPEDSDVLVEKKTKKERDDKPRA